MAKTNNSIHYRGDTFIKGTDVFRIKEIWGFSSKTYFTLEKKTGSWWKRIDGFISVEKLQREYFILKQYYGNIQSKS